MPDLSLTPASLNLTVYAGLAFTLDLEWPADRLDGRTFTATVATTKGDITFDPDVDITGDVMSISVTGPDTTSVYGRAAQWRLYDTTDGPVGDDPGVIVMGGRFKSGHQFGTPTEKTVEVVDRVADVPVHVVGAPGASGPPGAALIDDYAGGTIAKGTIVWWNGGPWRANDDLTGQDPDTLDEDNFDAFGHRAPTSAEIIASGVTPDDIGAVSQSDGGKEKRWNDTGISGSYTPDITRGNLGVVEIIGDTTIHAPDVAAGDAYGVLLHIVQGTGGNHAIAWDTDVIEFITEGGNVPVPQTEEGKSDLVALFNEGDPDHWIALHNNATLQIAATFLSWGLTSAPATPPSGQIYTWADVTTHHLMQIDSDGEILDLTANGGAGGTGGGGGAGGSGVITQVPGQAAHARNASSNTITATLPDAATAGNLIVLEFQTDMSGGTITPPSGFTEAIKRNSADAIGWAGIWYKVAAGGETSFVFGTSAGGHLLQVTATEYEGNTATPLDQTAYAELHNTTNHFDITTADTTVASELAVCSVLTGGEYSGSGSLGWGSSSFGTKYDFGSGGAGAKTLSATGAVTASPTFPGGNQYAVGCAATFKAA
jgi:hypothetical protein